MLVPTILEELPRDAWSRERLPRLHRTLVRVLPVVVVAPLTVDLGGFREEMLIQSDFVNENLLPEAIDIVNQTGGLAACGERLIKAIIVFEVELDAQLGRPVLDTDLAGDDDLGVVEVFDQLLVLVLSRRLQLSLRRVELAR